MPEQSSCIIDNFVFELAQANLKLNFIYLKKIPQAFCYFKTHDPNGSLLPLQSVSVWPIKWVLFALHSSITNLHNVGWEHVFHISHIVTVYADNKPHKYGKA